MIQRARATLLENRIALFRPSPALAPFMVDRSRRIFVRSANRTGKTKHACVRLAKTLIEEPGRYRAVGVNHVQTTRVLGKYLYEYLPPSLLVPNCRYSPENGWTHGLIRLRNGSECQLLTDEMDARAHAGDDLDGVLHDEPPREEILSESQTRTMARNGWIWVAATPINAPVAYLKRMIDAEGSPWKEYVVPLTPENCPWYTRKQVLDWIDEAAASPGTYRQKVFGDWEGDTVDRTFTGWGPDCIVRGSLDSILGDEPYTLGIGVDHGEGVGKQVAVIVVWTHDRIYVIDEIVNERATTPDDDARAILKRLDEWGWRLDEVQHFRGDVNSGGKLAGGQKVNDLLCAALHRQAGFKRVAVEVQAADKGRGSVEYGERLLNNALLRGSLLVHDRCATLIRCLRHYSGEEALKHLIDSLRYIIVPILADRTGTTPRHSRLRLT